LICYVRHGQTFDNVDQIIAGHNPGKLTKIGIDQAHQTGTALKDAEFDYIYVSDLNRTR
jgi:probable phosphoglycerate mutase